MTRVEKALALHKGGSACSQAVFAAFAPDFSLDEAFAHKIASGLGGGIGRTGLCCGAITGGVLAISLLFGNESGADQAAKLDTYSIVAKFLDDMGARHGATACRDLLGGVDLWDAEQRASMHAAGLGETVCNRLIADVVSYVEKLLPGGNNRG